MEKKLEKMNTARRDAVAPRVDVFENDNEVLLVADLPGVTKDDVDLRFHDGELAIAAKRAPENQGALLFADARPADYQRAFALPEGLDLDAVRAELANGVLSIHLPKQPAKRPRRIEVRGG
jgi:HSP20 family molecular chaperone IbpA